MKQSVVLVCLALATLAACKGKGDDFQVPQGDDQMPLADGPPGGHPEAGPGGDGPPPMVDADPTSADLAITISDAPDDPVAASTPLTYQVNVVNHGPADITSTVTALLHLPSGNVTYNMASGGQWTCTAVGQLLTCTRPNLLVGAAPTLDVVVTPQDAGTVTLSGSVSSMLTDGTMANNTASESTTVLVESDLAIKHQNPTTTTSTGGTLTYPLAVTNLGPSAATNVVVSDTLPTGSTFVAADGAGFWTCSNVGLAVSCTAASLAKGPAPLIAITATAPSATGTVTNTASVTSAINDPTSANNSDAAMTSVTAPADLSVAISASPDPVAANSTLTYSIDVTNAGPGTAANVTVTDTLPDGNVTFVSATNANGWACSNTGQIVTCNRSTLIVGAAPTIKIVITTPATFTSLTDGVTVASPTDNNATNNSASTTTNGATPHADLSVAIATSADPVAHGQSPTHCQGDNVGCEVYTVQVANAGPQDATGVSVVLALPTSGSFYDVGGAVGSGWVCPAAVGGKITCTRGSGIASGATAPDITLYWTAPSPGGFSITLGAEVDATSSDPDLTNNTATASVKVNP